MIIKCPKCKAKGWDLEPFDEIVTLDRGTFHFRCRKCKICFVVNARVTLTELDYEIMDDPYKRIRPVADFPESGQVKQ